MKSVTLLDSVHSVNKDFQPNPLTVYTFRFVFYGGKETSHRFNIVSGVWEVLEAAFSALQLDKDIVFCVAEYLCEYDSTFCGIVVPCKYEKKEEN